MNISFNYDDKHNNQLPFLINTIVIPGVISHLFTQGEHIAQGYEKGKEEPPHQKAVHSVEEKSEHNAKM